MTKIGFNFSGRIIDHLGKNSIGSNNTAIFELVKNARDANSTVVDISFDKGQIVIEDNGDGMSDADIREKWMVLGTDSRVTDSKTRRGKAVWGEMGIGRLACQKLGKKLLLKTVKRGSRDELHMSFDWSRFSGKQNVADVLFDEPQVYHWKDPEHGVTLEISSLESKWKPKDITNLREELTILLGTGEEGFNVTVNGEELKYSKFRDKVLSNAPFKLKAKFDGTDLSVRISNVWENKGRWEDQDIHDDYENSEIGPFTLDIYHFPRAPGKVSTHYIEQYYESKIGREKLDGFLKSNFNVMLYRDGAWFRPYGRDLDWLGIDTAKVQNPTRKLGIKEIYGELRLTKAGNPEIRQASHRESILRTPAFERLEKMIKEEILEMLRKKRDEWKDADKKKRIEEAGGDPEQPEADTNKVIKAIKHATRSLPSKEKKDVDRYLSGIQKLTETQIATAEDERDSYGHLREWENNVAMIGIAASHISREVGTALDKNMETMKEVTEIMSKTDWSKPVKKEIVDRSFNEFIPSLKGNQEKMKHFMKFVGTMGDHVAQAHGKNYRPTQVMVWNCWTTVLDGFDKMTNDLDIGDVGPKNLTVRINKIDLECILTHLFLNSYDSLAKSKQQTKKITVKFGYENGALELTFRDNGRGIPPKKLEKVFEPFEFAHQEENDEGHGHGLGLHFVKRIVEQNYDGKVEARDVSSGAEIYIRFSNVKKVSG